MRRQIFDLNKKRKNALLSVSVVMFCTQFLAYTEHIDWCYHSIHKHSSRSQHAPSYTEFQKNVPFFEGLYLYRMNTHVFQICSLHIVGNFVLNKIPFFSPKNELLTIS